MAETGVTDEGPIRFRNLLAGGAEVAASVFDDLDLASRAPADRPYVVVNMVETLDGRATLEGRTAKLSSPGDRALFHRLRAQGDAVLVGAGTVRVERYGRLIRDPELRALRARRGLGEPVVVIVSASLRIDGDVPLLADPDARIIVLTSSSAELEGVAAHVQYVRGEGGDEMKLAPLLGELLREHGVRAIVCEGGPTLNDGLLSEDLVDELFVSITPLVAGGPDPLTIVSGATLPTPLRFELAGLLESDSHLYARYRRR